MATQTRVVVMDEEKRDGFGNNLEGREPTGFAGGLNGGVERSNVAGLSPQS